jgi:hypothetical protein
MPSTAADEGIDEPQPNDDDDGLVDDLLRAVTAEGHRQEAVLPPRPRRARTAVIDAAWNSQPIFVEPRPPPVYQRRASPRPPPRRCHRCGRLGTNCGRRVGPSRYAERNAQRQRGELIVRILTLLTRLVGNAAISPNTDDPSWQTLLRQTIPQQEMAAHFSQFQADPTAYLRSAQASASSERPYSLQFPTEASPEPPYVRPDWVQPVVVDIDAYLSAAGYDDHDDAQSIRLPRSTGNKDLHDASTTKRPLSSTTAAALSKVAVRSAATTTVAPTYMSEMSGVAVARQGRRLKAWDCSEPSNITTISLRSDPDRLSCTTQQLKKKQKRKTYLLLQEVGRVKMKVERCQANYFRVVYTCQDHSHAELAISEWRMDEPYLITGAECEQMWRKKQVTFHQWEGFVVSKHNKGYWTHNLTLNAVNHFTHNKAGWVYHGGNQVNCQVAEMPVSEMKELHQSSDYYRNKKLTNVVGYEFINIHMFEHTAYLQTDPKTGKQEIYVPDQSIKLHCDFKAGACETGLKGVYVWKNVPVNDPDMCSLFTIKRVSGLQVQTTEQEVKVTVEDLQQQDQQEDLLEDPGDLDPEELPTMFVSTNGTMLRVKKMGRPQVRCGGVVYGTEYPGVFLSEDFQNPLLSRPIESSELNPFLAMIMGDHFVFERIQDKLSNALMTMQLKQCLRQKDQLKRDTLRPLARQKAVTDGDTAHVGDGIFITAVGDVAYMYHCRPVVVTAIVRPDKACYDALPVKFENATETKRFEDLALQQGRPTFTKTSGKKKFLQFWMSRISHRILLSATEVPCVPLMPAIYENLDSNWIKHTGDGIHMAISPTDPFIDLEPKFFRYVRDKLASPKDSSMYEWDTIVSFMTLCQTGPGAVTTVAAQILRNAGTVVARSGRRIIDAFGQIDFEGYFDVVTTRINPFSYLKFGWFYNFLEQWGLFCIVLMVCHYTIRLVFYVCHTFLRLIRKEPDISWPEHVANAFFPSTTKLCVRGQFNRDDPPGPLHDICEGVVAILKDRGYVHTQPPNRPDVVDGQHGHGYPGAPRGPLYPPITPPPDDVERGLPRPLPHYSTFQSHRRMPSTHMRFQTLDPIAEEELHQQTVAAEEAKRLLAAERLRNDQLCRDLEINREQLQLAQQQADAANPQDAESDATKDEDTPLLVEEQRGEAPPPPNSIGEEQGIR